MNFKKLTEKLEKINFAEETSEEPKKKKGKKVEAKDLQTGDYIKIPKLGEYVLTDYIDQIHGNDQHNMMQEPNIICYKAFNCETEEIEEIKLKIDDKVEVLKNDNDLFHIVYVKNKIENAEKIAEKHSLTMLAKNKSEVEERLEEKKNIRLVKLEKLIHGKVKNNRYI